MARTFQLLRPDAYWQCPISAEIRAVDRQSNLGIFFTVLINPLSPNIHGRILQTGLSVGIIYTEVTGVGAYSEPSADT